MNKKSDNLYSYIIQLKNIALMLAVYLYFMGWTYLHYYMYKFGLSILSLDLNLFSILAFSWSVIMLKYVELIIIHLIGYLIYLATKKYFPAYRRPVLTVLLLTGILVAFILSKSSGVELANKLRFEKSSQSFSLVVDSSFVKSNAILNKNHRLPNFYMLFLNKTESAFKLISETNEYFILLYQKIDTVMPNGKVFFVPKKYVKLAAINLTTKID